MTDERRDRLLGETMDEVINGHVGELDSDGVALAVIIADGRHGFDLEGDELIDFVRRCITAMLEHGAKPVSGGGGTRYYWIEQSRYGSTTREIVDNVIAAWLANGDPDHGGLWFAMPHLF